MITPYHANLGSPRADHTHQYWKAASMPSDYSHTNVACNRKAPNAKLAASPYNRNPPNRLLSCSFVDVTNHATFLTGLLRRLLSIGISLGLSPLSRF